MAEIKIDIKAFNKKKLVLNNQINVIERIISLNIMSNKSIIIMHKKINMNII